jgi:hypothetical protein
VDDCVMSAPPSAQVIFKRFQVEVS